MAHNWQRLTLVTAGREIIIERVRLVKDGIAIEGEFELPELARLPYEDQVFIAAFVRSHGSIKQMERFFGVSYPTIKNRLNRLGEKLDFVAIDAEGGEVHEEEPPVGEKIDKKSILEQVEKGLLNVDEAVAKLMRRKIHERFNSSDS